MIPQISEINFPEYATLHEATASFADMGERTITTQVRIDGDVIPDFDGWELEFKGERFVLPVKDPQARKDNTTRNSLVDLTFYSWPIYQMKRFFFFETTTSATGTVMADKYKASVNLNLVDFVSLFNRVLNFYFNGKIVADLASGSYSPQTTFAQIDYSYIWDVLQNFYELYGVRWKIVYDPDEDVYTIKIGYPADVIEDHNFEYGFEGGLLHFERQVEDDNIKNILLGRGGEKNLPYRYFKKVDPNNPEWAADPDAIKELENIYFDRLRDSNFRSYVQGWKTNPLRELYPGESVETYDSDRGGSDWAYKKGHEDTSFDPVEYVKDQDSIDIYGERWGALDDNDDIYPTIQGATLDGLGRVDEVVAVSDIITDDVQANMETIAEIVSIGTVLSQASSIPANSSINKRIRGGEFTVPTGKIANLRNNGWFATVRGEYSSLLAVNTELSKIRVYYASTDEEVVSADQGLSAGTYYYVIDVTVRNFSSSTLDGATYGVNGLDLVTSDISVESWKPTFDIWVKNIFDSAQGAGESDEDYSLRIWGPILGDRLGNEAKLVFSDGPMSISENYEFTIASYPTVDRTKVTSGGYSSEWKISLYKSDAEFDVSGLYIPNNTSGGKPVAGNHFFFIGIDMPNIYVTMAEKRITDYKTIALGDASAINPTWVIEIDKVRADMVNTDSQRLFDKIAAGCEMHVKDKRFTGNQVLTLFANTVSYRWQEPSDGNPYILPDIEVVVSEKIVVEKSASDKMRGDIDLIKSTYAKRSDIVEMVPQLTAPSYLKKTGEEEVSLSPTKFASLLTSTDFQQGGIGGQGWGLYRDNSSLFQEPEAVEASALMAAPAARPADIYVPDSVLEIDKLIVRKDMQVNNLVINQISSIGGKQILSAASIECIQVVENEDSYDCYFDQKQGTVKNLFVVNDIAMGQVFTVDNAESRYYKMLVTAVDVDHITLAKMDKVGSGVPQKGDIIVQYGNTADPSRQYAIVRNVVGGGYERMLTGLNNLVSNGVEYYFAGYDPNIAGDAKGRLYIGGVNSYIEFKQALQKLTVKGDIVADTLVLNGKTEEREIEEGVFVTVTVPSADINGLMVMRDASITEGDNVTTFLDGVLGDNVIFGAAMSGAYSKSLAYVSNPLIPEADRPDFLLYRDTTNNRVRIYIKDLEIGDSTNTLIERLTALETQFDRLYIGTTQVQKVSSGGLPRAQDLTGITSINFNNALEDEIGLEVITVNGQRVLHTSLPFCSDMEVTAGGVGSGGGGGGEGGGCFYAPFEQTQGGWMPLFDFDDLVNAYMDGMAIMGIVYLDDSDELYSVETVGYPPDVFVFRNDSDPTVAKILTVTETSCDYEEVPIGGLPSGGTVGQVLTKTASGSAWEDIPTPPDSSPLIVTFTPDSSPSSTNWSCDKTYAEILTAYNQGRVIEGKAVYTEENIPVVIHLRLVTYVPEDTATSSLGQFCFREDISLTPIESLSAALEPGIARRNFFIASNEATFMVRLRFNAVRIYDELPVAESYAPIDAGVTALLTSGDNIGHIFKYSGTDWVDITPKPKNLIIPIIPGATAGTYVIGELPEPLETIKANLDAKAYSNISIDLAGTYELSVSSVAGHVLLGESDILGVLTSDSSQFIIYAYIDLDNNYANITNKVGMFFPEEVELALSTSRGWDILSDSSDFDELWNESTNYAVHTGQNKRKAVITSDIYDHSGAMTRYVNSYRAWPNQWNDESVDPDTGVITRTIHLEWEADNRKFIHTMTKVIDGSLETFSHSLKTWHPEVTFDIVWSDVDSKYVFGSNMYDYDDDLVRQLRYRQYYSGEAVVDEANYHVRFSFVDGTTTRRITAPITEIETTVNASGNVSVSKMVAHAAGKTVTITFANTKAQCQITIV